jgi:hypothetical protein
VRASVSQDFLDPKTKVFSARPEPNPAGDMLRSIWDVVVEEATGAKYFFSMFDRYSTDLF